MLKDAIEFEEILTGTVQAPPSTEKYQAFRRHLVKSGICYAAIALAITLATTLGWLHSHANGWSLPATLLLTVIGFVATCFFCYTAWSMVMHLPAPITDEQTAEALDIMQGTPEARLYFEKVKAQGRPLWNFDVFAAVIWESQARKVLQNATPAPLLR